jgi:hypothetical protein
MTARVEQALRRFPRSLTDLVSRLTYGWRIAPTLRGSDIALKPLESAVQDALRPVEPSARFRESLRSNLSFAARRKITGLVIEHPRPFREGIVLGVSAGLLVATIATLVMVLRSHLAGSES